MLAERDLSLEQIDFLDNESSQIVIEYSSSQEELKVYLMTTNSLARVIKPGD